ncbi:MAG: hypothetical protein ACR2JU_00195 [Nocardioidaceae bacterium]
MAVMTEDDADQLRETRWSANTAWRDEFLAAGKVGLKGHSPAEDGMSEEQRRRLREAERKVGELTLDNDILRAAARKRGLEIPPAKRRR